MSIQRTFPPSADESTFEILDVLHNTDIWAEGLCSIERVGSCRRIRFAVIDRSMPERPHRIVVARLVVPAEALMGIARAVLADEQQTGASIDERRPLNAEIDPIIAAIEAHRRARLRFERICEYGEDPEIDAAMYVAKRAASTLLLAEATSCFGVAALLGYFAESTIRDKTYFPQWTSEGVAFEVAVARLGARCISKIAARAMFADAKARYASMIEGGIDAS